MRQARSAVTTQTANKLIADVWFARADFAKSHPDIIEGLVRGIFDAMEALKSQEAKARCAELMAAGYNLPASEALAMLADAHSTNWAENYQFFINQNNPASFERVWNQAYYLYRRIGAITHQRVPFDQVADFSIIDKLARRPSTPRKREREHQLAEDRILDTLQDNLQTCQQRLTNYQKAKDNYELVHFEIERLENKIRSISELAVNRQEPNFISAQVDQVADSMLKTEATINELKFVTGLETTDDAVPELVQREVVGVQHLSYLLLPKFFSRLFEIDLCLMTVLLKEVEQICTIHKDQRLVLGESVCIRTEVGSGPQNTFGCTFIEDSTVKISDSGNTDRVHVAFCLNNNLSSSDRIGIEGDDVDTAISAGSRHLDFAPTRTEFLLEQLAN